MLEDDEETEQQDQQCSFFLVPQQLRSQAQQWSMHSAATAVLEGMDDPVRLLLEGQAARAATVRIFSYFQFEL